MQICIKEYRLSFICYLLLFWIQIEAVNVCDKFMF